MSPDGDCRDKSQPLPSKKEFENFISSFNAIRGTKFQAIEKVKKQFYGRLKEGFTPAQMLQALENAMCDEYHIETGCKYLTPEFFTRSDKIDKFLNVNNRTKSIQSESNDYKQKFLNKYKNEPR
jgi:hypothetical protein